MTKPIMRFPNGLAKALTFSYDDGVKQDKRLIEIFDKHGLKGTFNINSENFRPQEKTTGDRLSKQEAYELFANSPHEVAVHTLTHPRLEQFTTVSALYEILEDKKNLEQMFGKIVRGMAYPFGTSSDELEAAIRACGGIVYARATGSSNSIEIPKNWLHLAPTCHHNSEKLFELGDKLINDEPRRAAKLMYVWGHSYEFDRNDNWHVIEEFAKKMAFRDDIWYATNIEIFDYILAYRSLISSADGHIIYNPTCRELFFSTSNNENLVTCIKPNETIIL